jgi:transcriptional regulator with XRE-family HTH domain
MYYNKREKEMISMLTSVANIREYRIARGMSQQELADMTGYKSRSSINKIEKGITTITLSQAKKIAYALGVELSDIVPSLRNPIQQREVLIPYKEQPTIRKVKRKAPNPDIYKEAEIKSLISRRDDLGKAFRRLAIAMIKEEEERQGEELNVMEMDLITRFRVLTPNNKQLISNMIETLIMQQNQHSNDTEEVSDTQKGTPSLQ